MNKPYAFSVNTIDDADIISYLDNLPNGQKSDFIRQAIRAKIATEQDLSNQQVLDTLLAAFDELKKGGVMATPPPHPNGFDENPEVANVLRGLGEW